MNNPLASWPHRIFRINNRKVKTKLVKAFKGNATIKPSTKIVLTAAFSTGARWIIRKSIPNRKQPLQIATTRCRKFR